MMQPMIVLLFVAGRHLIPMPTSTEKLALYMQSLLIYLFITHIISFLSVVASKKFIFAVFTIIIYVAEASGG